jgi:hypothetical protein
MIIWGTTNLKSTVGTGIFNCPQCQSEAPYTLKKATQFFTLYFIPLIPLGSQGQFVECNQCKGTFTEEILNYDPEEEERATQAAVFRILVAFMVKFHKTGEHHVAACQRAYSRLLDTEVPTEIVERELELAMKPDSIPENYIASEGNTFATEAKLQILASARNIILAEDVDNEHVQNLVGEFAMMLNLPEDDFEQIYEVVTEIANAQM